MNCPRHPDIKLKKIRLDVYGCKAYKKAWLIHRLSEDYTVPNKR